MLSFNFFIFSTLAVFGLLINTIPEKILSVNYLLLRKFIIITTPIPLIFISVLLVYRLDGVDIINYYRLYNEPTEASWDPGFSVYIKFVKIFLHLDFSEFLLFTFFLNQYLIYSISKKLNLNYRIVLIIYLLHMLIVRDLSQFRVGLAISIFLFAFICTKNYIKYLLYLFSLSIHASIAPFMLICVISSLMYRRKNSIFNILLYIFIFLGVPFLFYFLLGSLSNFDERIGIYLYDYSDTFGSEVSSFGILLFISSLVLLAYFNNKIKPSFINYLSIMTFIYSFFIYLTFSNYSIFATRLANLGLSFYIFSIANSIIISSTYTQNVAKSTLKYYYCNFIIFLTLITSILLRNGNEIIIDEIVPKLTMLVY